MTTLQQFTAQHLEAICNILGDTSDGLTGSEISRLLSRCGISDLSPTLTKRHRLFLALSQRQQQDRCANNVVAFIQIAIDPVRFVENPAKFEDLRGRLNSALSFAGYQVGSDGKFRQVQSVNTLDEATQRANRLRSELARRNVHPDVIRFCKAELLQDDYFHAVLEATKSVADKIRQRSGLTTDGPELIDEAFGTGKGQPVLALNTLRTPSERSEQTGFMNLTKGLFGMFRNPTAHSPRISWPIAEQDALDLLTTLSLVHRKLDQAVKTTM